MPMLSALSPRAWKTAAMLSAAAAITLAPAPRATAGTAATTPTIASVSPYFIGVNDPSEVDLHNNVIGGTLDSITFPVLPFSCPAVQFHDMAVGTSPSSVALPGLGFDTVFQGKDGNLWMSGTGVTVDTQIPMATGTSPSAAGTPGGSFEFAWQGANQHLFVTGPSGPIDLTVRSGMLPMASGTSPSFTVLPSGNWAIAFQGSDHNLWFTNSTGWVANTTIPVADGTSPAIAAYLNQNDNFQVVWHNPGGDVWSTGPHGPVDLGIKMAPGTNPSLTEFSDGGYEVAAEGSNNHLWTSGTLTNGDTGNQMLPDSSPSIAATIHATPGGLPADDYYVAYGTPFNGIVALDNSQTVTQQNAGADLLAPNSVAPGTSPSLAVLAI
jgi:hypothetical protein